MVRQGADETARQFADRTQQVVPIILLCHLTLVFYRWLLRDYIWLAHSLTIMIYKTGLDVSYSQFSISIIFDETKY